MIDILFEFYLSKNLYGFLSKIILCGYGSQSTKISQLWMGKYNYELRRKINDYFFSLKRKTINQ